MGGETERGRFPIRRQKVPFDVGWTRMVSTFTKVLSVSRHGSDVLLT